MADAGHNAIIIKKIKKSEHGHHGGSWKVAYADFVTAMMAFFLLLWLLNVTTDDQKRGLADYFAPTTATLSRTSGSGDILSGRTFSASGSRVGDGGVPAVVVTLTPPPPPNSKDIEDENPDELEAVREQERFDRALEAIKQALNDSAELSDLSQNLLMDMTTEGMRIQIIDQDGGALFHRGSAEMAERTRMLLGQIAQVVSRLPNEISVTGHTDATPFGGGDYTNWELSTDRALASRRVLVAAGIDNKRIVRVVGRADQEPLIEEDPFLPQNRRISILVLRGAPVLPPEYNE